MKVSTNQLVTNLVLVLTVLLFSSASFGQSRTDERHPQPHETAIMCPSQDKDEFIKAFSENVELQKVFTIFPLKYSYIDQDVYKTAFKYFKSFYAYEYKWSSGNIFPNKNDLDKNGISDVQIRLEADRIHVTIANSETLSYALDYFFKSKNGCWNLYLIVDKNI